jgi:hypothetical protein
LELYTEKGSGNNIGRISEKYLTFWKELDNLLEKREELTGSRNRRRNFWRLKHWIVGPLSEDDVSSGSGLFIWGVKQAERLIGSFIRSRV